MLEPKLYRGEKHNQLPETMLTQSEDREATGGEIPLFSAAWTEGWLVSTPDAPTSTTAERYYYKCLLACPPEMMAETAFCTSCGAVVGEHWELCEACGARQPVEVTATGRTVDEGARASAGSSTPRPAATTPLSGHGQATPAATYLFWLGLLCVVAGIVYLFATAGFPPGITTTYEYHADGSTSTSTSPDAVEGIITVALFLIGAVLMRASRAAKP